VDGERVSEGHIVAKKRSNVRGAKEPSACRSSTDLGGAGRPIIGWHRNWPPEFYGTRLLHQTSGRPCWAACSSARRMVSRHCATSRTAYPSTAMARAVVSTGGTPGSTSSNLR